jgi:methyl-accepting chemotaxis protein
MLSFMNQLKISTRLYIFFSISLFSMLFIIISNVTKLANLGSQLSEDLSANQKKSDYILEINVIALNKVRTLVEILSTKDIAEKKNKIKYISDQTEKVTKVFADLETISLNSKDKDLVIKANESRKLFVASKEKILELSLLQGKDNEILLILSTETLPRLKNYLEFVNRIHINVQEKTLLVNERLIADNKSNAYFQIIFLCIFIPVKIIFLIWIIFSIVKPLRITSEAIEKLSEGDFTSELILDKSKKDEFNIMLQNFQKMKYRLLDSIKKIRTSSNKIQSSYRDLVQVSHTLNLSAMELASSSEETSAATEEVSATLENVTYKIETQSTQLSSINENLTSMNHSIQDIKALAEKLSSNSTQSSNTVSIGETNVKETMDSMDKIKGTSKKITEIVGLISEISSQTNLLALNASIEAARAGESGRGFSIVADSINKLADRTVISVKQIQALITASETAISEGYNKVSDLSDVLKVITKSVSIINSSVSEVLSNVTLQSQNSTEITNNSDKVSSLSKEISIASNEQKLGILEINDSVSRVATSAQTVSSEASFIKDLSDEFAIQTKALDESVSFFKLD